MRLVDIEPYQNNGWHLEKTGVSNMHTANMSCADIPTVDVEIVKHGKWIGGAEDFTCGNYKYECSCCKCYFNLSDGDGDYYYCPNCGAKMQGENDE